MGERIGTQKMQEVVDAILSQYGLTDRMREMHVINNWSDFAGAVIAAATIKIDIYNRIIFLKVNSAIVRNEILMSKSQLMERINGRFSKIIIDDIVVQ